MFKMYCKQQTIIIIIATYDLLFLVVLFTIQ